MIQYIGNIIKGIWSLLLGLSVTVKNLFSHAVTLQYPKERQKMTDRFRGLVELNKEKCVSCMQCVKICPDGCLAIKATVGEDKKKVLESFVYDAALCCFCGFCEEVCPTKAIYMNKDYEVAVIDDRSLLTVDLMKGYEGVSWHVRVDQ
ncbi:MAG: NADH-quinone oxidoreductase subunit I [Candidatus Ancaeobacter aquaticus]|nr:NADH-quinone oxidoreductase subunit I [Candidatus Ancaeobacter aquaticus]